MWARSLCRRDGTPGRELVACRLNVDTQSVTKPVVSYEIRTYLTSLHTCLWRCQVSVLFTRSQKTAIGTVIVQPLFHGRWSLCSDEYDNSLCNLAAVTIIAIHMVFSYRLAKLATVVIRGFTDTFAAD